MFRRTELVFSQVFVVDEEVFAAGCGCSLNRGGLLQLSESFSSRTDGVDERGGSSGEPDECCMMA